MYTANDFERNEWIEYIRILRDIELSKMNSSFTISAVLLFVATLTNRLINNYSVIKANKDNMAIFILLFTISINVIMVLFRIINSSFRKKTVIAITRKKFTELDRQSLYAMYLIELLYDCIAIVANIYIVYIISINYMVTKWPYFVFLILNSIGAFHKLIRFSSKFLFANTKISRKVSQIKDNESIKEAEIKAEKLEKNKLFLLYRNMVKILYFLILIYSISFSVIEILKQNIIIKEYPMFINSACLIAILGSIQVISIYIAYRIRYSWLEQFERRIFIKNLGSKIIKQTLEVEYFNNANYEMFYFIENSNNM